MQTQSKTQKLYLTISEVCVRLSLSRETVMKLFGRDLPLCRFGPRSLRVPVSAVEHFESTHCER